MVEDRLYFSSHFYRAILDYYKKWGLRDIKSHPSEQGWIAPLYLNISFSKPILVMLMTLLPSLMGLWEEYQSSLLPFKGLELGNESPPFKWEWFSEPLDCPPNERCKPESMVGTMSPLEGNPRPFQGGEEVR